MQSAGVHDLQIGQHAGPITIRVTTSDGQPFDVEWPEGTTVSQATSGSDLSFGPSPPTQFGSIKMREASGDVNFARTVTELRVREWNDSLLNLPVPVDVIEISGANTISGTLDQISGKVREFTLRGTNTMTGDIGLLKEGLELFSLTGSNTATGDVAGLPSTLTQFDITGSSNLSGALSGLPAGLTRVYISGTNTTSGNVTDLPAGLTFYFNAGFNTLTGDLNDMPAGIVTIHCSGENTVKFAAGGSLPVSLTTLRHNSLDLVSPLLEADVDRIFAALVANGQPNGSLTITGTAEPPSAATQAGDKATLVANGWTVTHS